MTTEILSSSTRNAREWLCAQPTGLPTKTRAQHQTPSTRLPEECVSCFTDAARRASDGATGCGWIFNQADSWNRHQGSCSFTHIQSPLSGEALAVQSALTHALSSGITRFCIFSDCQMLVRTLCSKSPPVELYGITRDIEILSAQFDFFSLFFISRNLNCPADSIAKSALCNGHFLE